ncbi:TrkH family potassium uptake protein [Albidovulum sp.]
MARATMVDLRPVGYVTGTIVASLGAAMLLPMIADLWDRSGNAAAFAEGAIFSLLFGIFLTLSCRGRSGGLTPRQGFLMTAAIWTILPVFAALPLVLGAPHVRLIDAYFEAVSGLTTTGASVFVGIESLPRGVTLWRSLLNWLGGLGIAFIAMIFLPLLRVGGMQFFRTEGFDTFGKVLPRATDIARELALVYVLLTLACMASYAIAGMPAFEAVAHGLSTISTGGFSPRADSFSGYAPQVHYVAILYMLLGSFPYIRYVQLLRGHAGPLWTDAQVRGYLLWIGVAALGVAGWRVLTSLEPPEPAFRETLFNLVSIMSSSGFGTGDFARWGSFAVIVAMWLGLIGACSGSSAAGLSVFRVQVMFAALAAAIRRQHAPHRVELMRYQGRAVGQDTLDAIILYLGAFLLAFGISALLLVEFGLDMESAIFAAWTAIANIGYGFGPVLERTGTFIDLSDGAKLVMILDMILGRLSLLAILVLAMPRFWQS